LGRGKHGGKGEANMEGSGWRVEVSGISRQFLEKFPRIFRENFGISGNRTGFTEI